MNKNIPYSLRELENFAYTYGTPYYIYDGNAIISNARIYMDTFRKYFPNFRQFYAVKANPNPSILQLLADCDMDFDCSSPEEIKIINLINGDSFNKRGMIYTSNYTSVQDLNFAVKNNCIINLDDIDGLYNLLKINSRPSELLCFRYNPDITNHSEIVSNNFSGSSSKFGMNFDMLINAYKIAKENGFKRFGLHTMSLSNQLNIEFWPQLINYMFKVIIYLHTNLDIQIEFINIGGGIGIPYKENEREINLEMLVQSIKIAYDQNLNKYNLPFKPNLFTECGRYITGPYGYLVSSCKSIKKTHSDIFYGLDANMANLMRPGMYNAYHHISIPRLEHSSNLNKSNVVGTLCENNDWFAKNRLLPTEIQKEDLFVIHDVGAHGFSMGFNYNSKLRSCELLTVRNFTELIRDRETFDTLFHNTRTYKRIYRSYYLSIFLIFIMILAFILKIFFFNK
jgi:diaminopimelate decarboxylase